MDDGVALNPFSTGTDDEREAVKIAKKRMLYAEVDRERGIEPGGKQGRTGRVLRRRTFRAGWINLSISSSIPSSRQAAKNALPAPVVVAAVVC